MLLRTVFFTALLAVLPPAIGAAALPDGTVVHPGDHLHVTVAGEPDLFSGTIVAGDGTIPIPLAGEVHVGGDTVAQASAAITAALKPYLRDPHVTIDIAIQGQISVTVLGDVVKSGRYTLKPGATLSAAITAAGGMAGTINGTYPVARIANVDGTTNNISLDKLLRGGDPTRDIVLQDRSAIYVPGPTQFEVVVLGAVDHPGTVQVNAGDRLSIAIAKAGNSADSKADLAHIRVSRTEPNGTRAAHPINLYEALEKGDGRFDPTLQANDIVYVPVASQSHGNLTNAVFLLSRLLFLL